MAIKLAIYEVCRKCGAADARLEGDRVRYGLHDCPEAPTGGPPVPKWAGTKLLRDIIWVPAPAAPVT